MWSYKDKLINEMKYDEFGNIVITFKDFLKTIENFGKSRDLFDVASGKLTTLSTIVDNVYYTRIYIEYYCRLFKHYICVLFKNLKLRKRGK